jgi:type IV pilus assembly protein PilV
MQLPVPYNDDTGFTLVEFLVAVVIMTVGLLGVLGTVNVSISQNRSSKMRTDAIQVADEALALERGKSYDNVGVSTKVITQKSALGFVNYSVLNTITPLTTVASGSKHKQLQVTVSWHDKGVKKTHSLSSTFIDTTD